MLENIPLFAFLSPEARADLEKGAHSFAFKRGNILVSQGETSDSLYIVLSGKLKVFISSEDGREIFLNYLEEGEAFGELALLDGEPRLASVMALVDTRVAIISRQYFLDCLQTHPNIAIELLQVLSKRMRHLTDRTSSLALMDVYSRLVSTLSKLATPQDDGRLMTNALTHQELSSMIGASREMVTRILNDLKKGDYISIEDHRVVIKQHLPLRW